MPINNTDSILRPIISRFGVGLSADFRKVNEGLKITIRPDGTDPDEGFRIVIAVGWKTINLDLEMDDKAGELLLALGQATDERKMVFCSVAQQAIAERGTVTMNINGHTANPEQFEEWPKAWLQLQLSMKSPFIETDSDLTIDENLEEHILKWTSAFLSMILPLVPLKGGNEHDEVVIHEEGLPEGARTTIAVNRYERNRFNREACISIFGAYCQICGFDFRKKYGMIGDGFIEVHHITPVSQLGDGYLINPVKDLIPVCPNCHAMIHRKDPPYTIDEIREMIH